MTTRCRLETLEAECSPVGFITSAVNEGSKGVRRVLFYCARCGELVVNNSMDEPGRNDRDTAIKSETISCDLE